MTSNEQKNIEW